MLRQVKSKVTGGIFRSRMNINRDYLMELDSQFLLQNFYLEAGIIMPDLQVISEPEKTGLHWGWESPACQLRGHFLGHFLSAASKLYAYEKDEALKNKLDHIVSELGRCQKRNGGKWIGSIPEKYFDWMCGEEYIWSPQYTLHKTVMGLTHAYRYAGNQEALDIVSNLADWYLDFTERHPEGIYKGEQAGMLEMWAELYALTNDEKYKTLAERYQDNYLFEKLEKFDDALTDDHANASIPLSHGSGKMYEVTGDERWRKLTQLFWKHAVTDRSMYATTGTNAGEFWIPPHSQAEYICDRDQEFCTVYNMVRTADYLYRWTGDTKYADYIERAIYNGFLAQQNPHTGMPTYFLPLHMGARKKWGSKRNDFWCCHGTMIQSQTLYPELIAYCDNDTVTISQYIPAEINADISGRNVSLTLSSDLGDHNNQTFFEEHSGSEKKMWSFKISAGCDADTKFTLKLRVPCWAKEYSVAIDGNKKDVAAKDNYLVFENVSGGCEISFRFTSYLYTESLPDSPEMAAILDGPVVLAGLTDCDCGITGSLDDALAYNTEHLYSYIPWKQNCYTTRHQPKNFRLIPLYEVEDEQYTVYFTMK